MSGYEGQATISSWMFATACCLVVGLGLGLGLGLCLVSGWLVVMHTYLYNFRLSLSHCPHTQAPEIILTTEFCPNCLTVVIYDRRTLPRSLFHEPIHSSRRSGIPSCWTTVVEQPSVQPTTVQPYPSSVPPGVKDAFVWLTGTLTPSDFCF